jgi:MFS superfamily sulfate permease-like transporter
MPELLNEHQAKSTLPEVEKKSAWKPWVPAAQWLPIYQPAWLAPDLVAGMTLAAYAIPVSLAYASLAGLPPQVGIYGYLLGGIGYALFGSSRQMAVGPTSAISLMVGGTLAQMAGGDLVRYGQIASLAGFTVAALSILAFALRLSTLTNFISETILLGFKAGAGLTIASTQLASFVGVPGGGDNFFARVFAVVSQLGQINPAIALFGVAALALLVAGEIYLPGRPVALLVVVLSIAAVSLTQLGHLPLTLVGSVPAGLPELGLPAIRPSDIDGLLPLALGCLLLAYIEGVSAARAFVIFRVKASLLYFNAENVHQAVLHRVRIGNARLVIADLSNSPLIDLSAVRMLGKLCDDLAAHGAVLRVAELRHDIRPMFEAEHLIEKIGVADRIGSIADVMERFAESRP